jgi:hypothetical protein
VAVVEGRAGDFVDLWAASGIVRQPMEGKDACRSCTIYGRLVGCPVRRPVPPDSSTQRGGPHLTPPPRTRGASVTERNGGQNRRHQDFQVLGWVGLSAGMGHH